MTGEALSFVRNAVMVIFDCMHGGSKIEEATIVGQFAIVPKLEIATPQRLVVSHRRGRCKKGRPDQLLGIGVFRIPDKLSQGAKVLERVPWRSILWTAVPHGVLVQLP